MARPTGNGRWIRKGLRAALFAALMLTLPPGTALAKKRKDKNAVRLETLQTVFVQGSDLTAMYVRRNLEGSTCLKEAAVADEADALLEVWEDTVPCRMSPDRFCLGIRARLMDRKTRKTLWFRSDDDMGSRLSLGGGQTAGKWVLWQLSGSCCKGR